MDRKETIELIKNIHALIGINNLEELDKILLNIDLSAEPVILITYLRSSFSVKNKLQNWVQARNKVALELTRRKLDAKSILSGLFQ